MAQKITFNFGVYWGYQEYVDILKVVWQLNQTIPEGSRKFRLLGLNDTPDWSFIKTQADRENIDIMQKVWEGCGEHLWAKVIINEVVNKGDKALVYSGIHHAFTEYKQPSYNEATQKLTGYINRFGNYIYNEIGKNACTIFLHSPWNSAQGYNEPLVYSTDGIIDALMTDLSPKYQTVGFDTQNSPFGKLPGETSIYKHGYENFTLEMYCDGYIFQKPISEYTGITAINGFINDSNVEQARLQFPNPAFRKSSIKKLNNVIKDDAKVEKHFLRFW